MNRTRSTLAALVMLIVSGMSLAQYPIAAVGFYASTNTGHAAGSACWWFNCTPANLGITAGEVLTVRINGEHNAPYFLATAPTATNCVTYSGIYHSLVLDLPATIVDSGTLAGLSPILSCPNGYSTLTATVPPGIPTGTTFAIQALTYGAGNVPAFTGAIILTIT